MIKILPFLSDDTETISSSNNHIQNRKRHLGSRVRHFQAGDSRGSYLEELIGQLVTAELMDVGKSAEISSDTSLIKCALYICLPAIQEAFTSGTEYTLPQCPVHLSVNTVHPTRARLIDPVHLKEVVSRTVHVYSGTVRIRCEN